MAENTEVGPAGANSSALPVTSHQTKGHLDDVAGGSDEAGNISLSGTGELSPVNP